MPNAAIAAAVPAASRRTLSTLRALLASTAVLTFSGALTAAQAAKLYVFGDSLSDNGNLSTVTFGLVPGPDYFQGRFSNGPVWAERLGFDLGRDPGLLFLDPFLPFFSDGYDFAHGGASSANRWYLPDFLEVQGQADEFSGLVRSRWLSVSRHDIGTVWAGANDYILYGETSAANSVGGVINTLTKLDSAGMRRLVVFNLPLLGNTPGYINTGQRDVLNAAARAHNQLLAIRVAQFDAASASTVTTINAELAFNVIMTFPSLFGFSVVRPGDNGSATGYCLGDGLVLSACPDSYLFYDTVHPTRAGHDLIAQVVNGALGGPALSAAQGGLSGQAAGTLSGAQGTSFASRMSMVQTALRGDDTALPASARLGISSDSLPLDGRMGVYTFGTSVTEDAGLPGETRTGFSAQTVSGTGADLDLGGGVIAGVSLAWSDLDASLHALASVESKGRAIQAYAAYVDQDWLASIAVNAQTQSHDLIRASFIKALPAVSGRTYSRSFDAALSAQYDLMSGEGWGFGPKAALFMHRDEVDGYRETGALGLVELNVPDRMEQSAGLSLGLAARGSLALSDSWHVSATAGIAYWDAFDGNLPQSALFTADRLMLGQVPGLGTETGTATVADLGVHLTSKDALSFAVEARQTEAATFSDTSVALKANLAF